MVTDSWDFSVDSVWLVNTDLYLKHFKKSKDKKIRIRIKKFEPIF